MMHKIERGINFRHELFVILPILIVEEAKSIKHKELNRTKIQISNYQI